MNKAIQLHLVAAMVWLAFLCSDFAVKASEFPPQLVKFHAERDQMAANLAAPISVCVARQDTAHPAFHGCIDWHSAVHGVWALMAYAWAMHDTRYDALVKSILTSENLIKEQKYLAENPNFEMPYGRAWFLRLAIDARKIHRNDVLESMADDVAASLVKYLTDTQPDPSSIAYSSSTWALINLYDFGRSRNDAKLMRFVSDVVKRDYLHQGACPVQEREINTEEFMALCTNWAWLVSDVLPPDEFAKWLSQFLPADQLAEPIKSPSSVHQNGLNFSRSWGLWTLYWRTKDSRYLEAYLRHMRQAYSQPETWNGSYETVAHWVPQFGMLGLMVSYYDWP